MSNDHGLGFQMTRRAQLSPERTALIFREETWSYRDLHRVTNRVAHGLHALGVNPGDRVGFLGLNHPRFLFTLYGAAKLDAIFVPLNFRLTGPELAFIVRDAGLHTLVYEENFATIVDEIRDQVRVDEYVCGDARDGSRSFDDLVHDQRDTDLDYPVADDDIAWIMYTSGTTGRPKGAMITHGNILWNNINASLAHDGLMDDVSLAVAPLFHIGGLNVTPIPSLLKGATVVVEQMFEPGLVLELIERHHITTMFGVPAMFMFMAQHPDFATRDLSSVRVFVCGGAPVPEALIKLYKSRDIAFLQGYGLTETAPFSCFLPAEKAEEKLGSAGIAPFFSETKCVDENGREVPDGERGEIVCRGPNVMKGYWNRPDATAEVIIDGWFHTGDIGKRDADGYFWILDRKKDMIISGGENVYPAEIEDALYQHPLIKEVAAIGVQHPRWGETVRAVVVVKEGEQLSEQEVVDFTAGRLARYKQPRSVVFAETLPRNPTGKVIKFELRERFGHPMTEGEEVKPSAAETAGKT
ncbi:MAG: long-chain fatty acid--CoA ligase [Candidatus Dormibacteraeota bacterium]|nr:long-chain fatty acid--CoA ligase [Candidatus Dormibacteraeota bacterium]